MLGSAGILFMRKQYAVMAEPPKTSEFHKSSHLDETSDNNITYLTQKILNICFCDFEKS